MNSGDLDYLKDEAQRADEDFKGSVAKLQIGITDNVKRIADRAERAERSVNYAKEMIERARPTTQIREHPLRGVGMAVAAGGFVGYLWGRKRASPARVVEKFFASAGDWLSATSPPRAVRSSRVGRLLKSLVASAASTAVEELGRRGIAALTRHQETEMDSNPEVGIPHEMHL